MLFAQNVYHTYICGSSQLLSEESLELTTNTLKIKQEGVVAEQTPVLSELNMGNLSVFGNTHGLVSSDSIQMKGQFRFDKDGAGFGGDAINLTKMEQWMVDANALGENHQAFANKIGGQWAHVIYMWDATNGSNSIWVNGTKISNPQWESRNGGAPLNMVFFQPTHPILGATQSVANNTTTDVWNKALTGSLDEIRVFKKALTQAEINSLYQLELAGR
ncbi:MAG: hypothetical protein EOP49_18185 [Sphingobacteriales bacterium]|nr:MAG: hypothetical protein EOP49_18185 [Sphingobacteriales bacterium]